MLGLVKAVRHQCRDAKPRRPIAQQSPRNQCYPTSWRNNGRVPIPIGCRELRLRRRHQRPQKSSTQASMKGKTMKPRLQFFAKAPRDHEGGVGAGAAIDGAG